MPRCGAVGTATSCADLQGGKLSFRQGLVYPIGPPVGVGQRPVGERDAAAVCGVLSRPEATPLPVFDNVDQIRSNRIPLNVTADRIEVLITLHGKGLERTLVYVAFTVAATECVPASHMRRGYLMHELGQLVILFWPDDKVPVVWQDAIREDPSWYQ